MDEIESAPRNGTERETLIGFLDANREVMIWKADGMSDEAARQAPFSSDTSMIGLLQHLAVVERSWFQSIFRGEEVDYGFDFESDRDAEWHLTGDETVESATSMYRDAIAAADAAIEGADLHQQAAKEIRGEHYSLRWILGHMVEETARHAGHADIVREHLEGELGYLPQF